MFAVSRTIRAPWYGGLPRRRDVSSLATLATPVHMTCAIIHRKYRDTRFPQVSRSGTLDCGIEARLHDFARYDVAVHIRHERINDAVHQVAHFRCVVTAPVCPHVALSLDPRHRSAPY